MSSKHLVRTMIFFVPSRSGNTTHVLEIEVLDAVSPVIEIEHAVASTIFHCLILISGSAIKLKLFRDIHRVHIRVEH